LSPAEDQAKFLEDQMERITRLQLHRLLHVIGVSLVCLCTSLHGLAAEKTTAHPDEEIGAEAAVAVAAQMGFYDNAAVADYVTAVGERLVAVLEDDRFTFRFFVVDDRSPNAFALPGGFIFVTRGLLPLLQTEDELAGVMAHEIIHVTERHGMERTQRGLFGALLEAPGRVVGGLVDPRVGALINAPITGANKLIMANYSRDQEREADREGIELVARAGYDPSQLATFLKRMTGAIVILTGEAEQRSMLRDHPVTAERVSYLDRRAAAIEPAEAFSTGIDLYSVIDGIPIGPNPDRGIFVENQFLHPMLDLALVFPDEWQTFNLPIAVGAISPEQNGALFYSLEESAGSPTSLGERFAASLPDAYRQLLDRAEPVTVNGIPGYVVTLSQDPRSGERIYMHIAWMAFDTFTLRLAAYGTDSLQETLRTSARSFRLLADTDRAAIQRVELGIATAEAGESFAEFSQRVGNRLNEDLTRSVNDLEQEPLGNQRLKIVEVRPYFGD